MEGQSATTPRRCRIAVLRSDEPHHRYLEALLRSRFDVVAVVVEPGRHQRQRLLHRHRYVDYGYNLYHHVRRKLVGGAAYREGYFAEQPAIPASSNPRIETVRWINDPIVIDLLEETRPDVTVIICTSILREKVLTAASRHGPVINVHGGYLPYYRGNHCFFFALYNREFDRIGSSLHFVDKGVDTGDLIDIVVPPILPDDTAAKLYCRAEKLAIHRLAEILADYERGVPLPRRPQPKAGHQYRTRDRKPHHDVVLWLRRRHQSATVAASPETR